MFFIDVNVVPVSDLQGKAAAKAFMGVNPYKGITLKGNGYDMYLETDDDPSKMIFPKGWYTAKGYLRNKHMSSGIYTEIPLFDNLGQIINEFLDNSISNFAGNRCETRNIIIRLKELEANGDVRISRGFRNRNKNVELSIFVGEQVRCGVST